MRRYLVFVVASMVLLLSTIDSTAVAVAYPVIISYFNISLVVAGWVLSAYQVAMISALPISGKISDSIGRKTAFLIFVSLFGIGSLLCSLAPNAPTLILFRIFQGLGGSGLGPTTIGLVAAEDKVIGIRGNKRLFAENCRLDYRVFGRSGPSPEEKQTGQTGQQQNNPR